MKLGWIDFAPEDRKRAIDALNALRNRTEDELGTGVVRDAFAEAFFPGTSTIQTRAKYFVIVPCAIQMALENLRGESAGRVAMERLRQIERECARQMWNNCDHDETAKVIGRQELDNPKWIIRPPSEIYWAGLRTFGISRIRKSVGAWMKGAGRYAGESAEETKRRRRDDEDGGADDADTRLADWKEDIPIPKDIFQDFSTSYHKKTLKPELTKREADFLRESILSGTPGSLLAFYLSTGREPPRPKRRSDEGAVDEKDTSFYKFARNLKGLVSAETASLLDRACEFNRLNFSANVLYNKMLGIPEAKARWEMVGDSVPGWMSADPVALPPSAGTSRFRTDAATRFLNELREAFRERNFGRAERLIEKRERTCCNAKNKKAKLDRRGLATEWVGVGWHDFRLANAARILGDITHPEEAADA